MTFSLARGHLPTILLLLAFAHPSHAAELCNGAGVEPTKVAKCYEGHLKAADKDLNNAYQSAIEQLRSIESQFAQDNPGQTKLDLESDLRAAQRAWLIFRNHQCGVEGNIMLKDFPTRGEVAGQTEIDCEIRMDNARAAELNDTVKS